ncbi:peptidoglycan D,D-transpeptidase FtsI family protein [Paeniglutamicibacter cryotolerans]|uniref:Cell division protein FtsI (Penicillin-binding protein 3) n=1 Tax=Paeniglutamicibacter cryotolerans TaxID=670079 RepID=A0A839QRM5_9MICC|nr:penicillin-binding protein 2 [Paeniglutamicibacter cryotolerans]MBB2996626.1 cell division protein FtsI (penicillin-binding protein 3) [Paeniglutamicibacter cryotolerans]
MNKTPATGKAQAPGGAGTSGNLRLFIALLLSLLLLVTLGGRLFYIQGMDPQGVAAEAVKNRTKEVSIEPRRGQILDANGTILATSVDRYDLVISQKDLASEIAKSTTETYPRKNPETGKRERITVDQAVAELSQILGLDEAMVKESVVGVEGAEKKTYSVIAKSVTPEMRNAAMEVSLPAMNGMLLSERQYPNGVVAGPLLGFMDSEGKGAEGLELSQEAKLAGTAGKKKYEAGGDGIRIPIATNEEIPVQDGQSVRLTINTDIQYVAQEAVAKKAKEFKAEWVNATVLNLKTGEIIALGDSKSMDPNDPGATDAESRTSTTLTQAFEPGSTGKVATFAAALEEGVIKPTDQFKVANSLRINGETINDSLKHSTFEMTAAGIFARSYNTGTVMVGNKLENKVREDYMRKLGIGAPIDLGVSGFNKGILAPSSDWERRQQYNIMFGQGYTQTALHTAKIFQTVANGGVQMEPSLIDAYIDADGTEHKVPEAKPKRVFSKKTSDEMLRMMETVVQEGTGKKMAIEGYRVGGKSGTAQAAGPTGKYDGYTSSFAGVAPLDDPQFVVVVTMHRPKGNWKSWSVGDTFTEIMSKTLNTYNVPPSKSKPNGYNVFVGTDQQKSW